MKNFIKKSPLMVQKNGDVSLNQMQYKWASFNCLCIFPLVMSFLLIPLAYNKNIWTFLKEYFFESLDNGFAWKDYLPIVFSLYYCCILIHIIITMFFIENIHLNIDLVKKILTLVLPVYLIVGWGTPLPKKFLGFNIESKPAFFILIALILIGSYLFSEFFEYINMRAEGKWYVTKPLLWGLDFTNWIYYLMYAIFTFSTLIIEYLCAQLSLIVMILCAVLLLGVAVLLGWERKGVNNLIACEMAVITANMSGHKLIYLEMYFCVILALYFTEQLQIWIKRFIKKTTVQEQQKYINDIGRQVLSGYGIIGIVTLVIVTLLKRGL